MLRISAIYFGLFVYICVVVAVENQEVNNNKTRTNFKDESYVEVLKNLMKLVVKSNLMSADEENESIPIDVDLNQVYTECLSKLSFLCLQKKLIAFLYKLDGMKNISLIGKAVLFVRKNNGTGVDTISSVSKITEYVDQAHLKDVIDNLIDKFFENHSLRLRIPGYFENAENHNGEGIFLDIDFGSTQSSANFVRESRRRRPQNNKHKGIKKVMMLIGLMTCIKLAMMAPLMLGLLGLKAMKALILAVMSLTISKMMMLSKVNMHNLLQGSQWYSSGGDGWDRNIQETSITSTLPYNMEPPAAYSTYTVRTVK